MGCTFAPVLLAAAALLGNVANAAEAAVARVTAFTPQGPSRDVRQVTARFSEPMVSLGDPRAAAPFTVTCAVPGHGRWADTRNWVYDFERDLPAGLSCSLALTTGLRSVAGNAAGGTREFRFNTGGPALRASLPQDGSDEIDTDQAFIVAPDAAVDPATVTTRVACAVDNIAERIPVEILTGAAREAVLTQRRALGFRYFRLLARSEGDSAPTTAQLAAAEADLLVIRCRRSLPADTAVRLVWGAGVRAVTGLATTQDQVLQFRTRPPFTVKVACERVNAESPCLPMRPVRVMFSAPVPRERAGVVLVDAVGKRRLDPRVDKATAGKPLAPVVEELVFNGPFTERGSVTVQLPATLQDDSGRTAANAARFPLKVDFDEAPPLAKFAGEFGILEKKTGGILPVTIRNIESPVQAARLTPGTVGDIAARSLRLADDAQVARWLQRVENAMQSRGEWQAARGDVPGRWNELTGVTSVFAAGDATTAFSIPRATGEKTFEVIG
ncbi:MAG: hypothetical protein ABI859_15380, partial [Pseudomonadota bacterium]